VTVAAYVPSLALVERVAAGEVPAAARLISRAEGAVPEARAALAEIYRRAGRAHVIGVTGVPGSGKSTLVSRLAERLRARGGKVGIVAVDPSSPYSGGSILGDRIRMSDLVGDPGIFIRSMATRGAVGGLARATLDAVDILDVAGYATIVIETVGVGQDEVEIARASHTTVVVSAPGLGDEVQAIKAGILEIADIHVVSKADRSDAARTLADLKQMLIIGLHGRPPGAWPIPVLGVSAYSGEGLDALVEQLAAHRAAVSETEAGAARRRSNAAFRLEATAQTLLAERFARGAARTRGALADRLADRKGDPYSLAAELVATAMGEEPAHEPA
jgi:LAO/AO transport system kinase